jgi:predicted small lipoprotein YifL
MMDRSLNRIAALLCVLALAAGTAACGKKGDLEPPDGKKSEFPKQYPRTIP